MRYAVVGARQLVFNRAHLMGESLFLTSSILTAARMAEFVPIVPCLLE